MELTLQEVTFLYQITEVKKIVGFDFFPMLDKKEVEEVKQKLVDKNIMLNGVLTDHGLTILDTLSLYREASVYYKLGKDTIFANYAEGEYIMFKKTNNNFTIEFISQELLVASILLKFKEWESIKEGEYRKRFLSKAKFRDFMNENENVEALFYYKVDLEAQEDTISVLFLADGYFQHYNAGSGELDMYPKTQVQHGIEEIFVRGQA